ncbi:MAG TPA: nucleotide pyrophosphohydrolase [Candidatus Norongarragalinales archaeon]|nr:nucleotide pyrophosphohydrolase [Candidatus Norongarragalinales archaeon]
MDEKTTLDQLKRAVADFRDARDWKPYHNPKDLAVGISIEANELLELFQWKTTEETRSLMADPKKAELIREELADIVIYCLSASDEMGIDLSQAIQNKLEKNERKYPADKARGSSKKYDEL